MKKAETNMLTVREVAERLDANPGTIRMWCINKTFPNAVHEDTLRGPVWLIPESDLKGFEKRGRGRPPKVAEGASKKGSKK
jgi:Helix-turn-helix domain